jgi:uncharacterized membrane protein
MKQGQGRTLEVRAALLFGIGMGGFFDGIVLHQILQWHHLVSHEGSYPVTTVAGLEVNTFWDGIFHTLTYIAVAVGLVLFWRAGRYPHSPWSTKLFGGVLLMGWGAFNLVEGTINHHLLDLHHVNETVAEKYWVWWDLGFLLWGAAMLIGGWMLARAGQREQDSLAELAEGDGGGQISGA